MHKPLSFSAALTATMIFASPVMAQARHTTAPRPAVVEPTGPNAVFDTSAGRMVCRLYSKQAPATVANFVALAHGTKDWADSSGVVQRGKPFFDGTQIFGMVDGVMGGDRSLSGTGSAGAGTVPEKTGLDFNRGGLLIAMVQKSEQSSSAFGILVDPDLEYSKKAVVFGQCDETSIGRAHDVSHDLLATDNRPPHPVVLRKVTIVAEGQPLPAPAEPIPGEVGLTVPPLPAPAVNAPEPTGPTAIIETTKGTLTCKLFSKEAPIGAANFIGLAEGTKPFKSPVTHVEVRGKRFYDGLSFARILPDYMIQNAELLGGVRSGDIGFKFNNEIVPGLTFDRPGRLAYANAGPGTNASEFFVTEHPVHRLDGDYTIFGQCDDASVKLVEEIARVPRDANNKPQTPVTIKHVMIQH